MSSRRLPPPPPSYYADTPRPSPRTNWTRRVLHPVLKTPLRKSPNLLLLLSPPLTTVANERATPSASAECQAGDRGDVFAVHPHSPLHHALQTPAASFQVNAIDACISALSCPSHHRFNPERDRTSQRMRGAVGLTWTTTTASTRRSCGWASPICPRGTRRVRLVRGEGRGVST